MFPTKFSRQLKSLQPHLKKLSTQTRNYSSVGTSNIKSSAKQAVEIMRSWRNTQQEPKSFNEFRKSFNEPFLLRQENSSVATTRILAGLNYWYKVPQDKFDQVVDVMQHCQDVLLLFDDILDGSELRRGKPTPQTLYPLNQVTNCTVYNFFKAQERAFELTNYDKKVIEAWSEYHSSLYRSEGYDKIWAKDEYCPTLEEYIVNMIYKIGTATHLCAMMLEHFSDLEQDVRKFSELFCTYYQFCDDYENYFMPESFFEGKEKFADDLTEGKYTLPTIHAIRIKGNKEIAEMMKKRPSDLESKRIFVKKMEEIGTKEFCKDILKQMDKDIRVEADKIGPNPIMTMVIDRINDWEKM